MGHFHMLLLTPWCEFLFMKMLTDITQSPVDDRICLAKFCFDLLLFKKESSRITHGNSRLFSLLLPISFANRRVAKPGPYNQGRWSVQHTHSGCVRQLALIPLDKNWLPAVSPRFLL